MKKYLNNVYNHLSELNNFILREFFSGSRPYFERNFYDAYSKITFTNKNDIIINNKSELKFGSFIDQFPFIEDLIEYRYKINTLEEYCDISFDIFQDYYQRLRQINTLYTSNFFESKNEALANNIVKDNQRSFFRNIGNILFLIEKYASNIDEKNETGTQVKSEYNLIVAKYRLLEKFNKIPFKYKSYKERNEKIIKLESKKYKKVTNLGSLKNIFNQKIIDIENFLSMKENIQYVSALLNDSDIKSEKEITNYLKRIIKRTNSN